MKNSHQLMSSILVLLPLLSNTQISNAQTVETETSEDSIHVVEMSEVLITGGKEDIQSLPGSAHIMDQQELEKFNYSDIHQVLSSTPGVYVRNEDGYGLRPNIGMRGAPAERSQKITVMEDGILIGPAPYSAPSAYYFPNVARMEAVEVFKGPVAIKYGPNTVGGALNMVSTQIPEENAGRVSASYGTDNYRKLHAYTGGTQGNYGFLVEGLTLAADGFKELDNNEDTGFERNDLNMKFRVTSDPNAPVYHRLDLNLGYSNEHSDETYLGLTDDDFDNDPYRRYLGSQLDNMEWDHKQINLSHVMSFDNGLDLTTRVYRHDFTRAWEKLEDFRKNTSDPSDPWLNAPVSISDVLTNPTGDLEQLYYQILTGEVNATQENQRLDVSTNKRDYISQGIDFSASFDLVTGNIEHALEAGVRLHNDYVEREHSVKAYNMINGVMVFDGVERADRLVNKGESTAFAAFVKDELTYQDWTVTAGLRGEVIDYEFTDKQDDSESNDSSDKILIPGLGAFYQFTDSLGFLVGVNKGFTPSGPISGSDDLDPEESINWEYGLRFNLEDYSLEAIGFFSDYSNLTGRCRTSDTGCDAGDGFNGGEAEISGLEFVSRWNPRANIAGLALRIPVNVTYTFTEAIFQSSFNSSFSQWGDVTKGDELPYTPEHQLRLESGLTGDNWDFLVAMKYTSEMRETAGQGDTDDSEVTDALTVFDLAANYYYQDNWHFQATVENLMDEEALVARRPLGARPNKPRTVIASVAYNF